MMPLAWQESAAWSDPTPRRRDPWRTVQAAAAVGVVVATLWPWCRVASERLFGLHYGPVGWRTDAGLTCLCCGLLAAMLGTLESEVPANRASAREAAMLLASAIAVVLGIAWWNGPGWLRGVPAGWTAAFVLVSTAATALATAACVRIAAARRSRAARLRLGSAPPPHSSSGPPT